ncbi:hypothetical protein LY76DRAFT_479096, partial [Colletotrichum caudatum]
LLFPGGGSLLRCSPPAACGEGFGRPAPPVCSPPVLPLFVRLLGQGYWASGRIRARFPGLSPTTAPRRRRRGRQ